MTDAPPAPATAEPQGAVAPAPGRDGAVRRAAGVALFLVVLVLAVETFALVWGDPALAEPVLGFWRTGFGRALAALFAAALVVHALGHLRAWARPPAGAPPGDAARAFGRASGLLLLVFAGVMLASLARFHAAAPPFPPEAPAFAVAQQRLSNPFWRWWDWTTLVLALAHGAVALARVVRARVATPAWRAAAGGAVLAAAALAASLATYAFLTLPFGFRNPMFGGP